MKTTKNNKRVLIDLKKYLSRRQIRKIVRFLDWCERTFTWQNILAWLFMVVCGLLGAAMTIYMVCFSQMWMW